MVTFYVAMKLEDFTEYGHKHFKGDNEYPPLFDMSDAHSGFFLLG